MFISGLLVASFAVGQAPTKPVDDDDDEIVMSGRQTFVENCLICHGEEMTNTQRLTTKQWTAEIDKMIGWGSPVVPDKKSALLAYLTTSYSDRAAAPKFDRGTATELIQPLPTRSLVNGDIARGGTLYTQHCATCHGPTGQGGDLGPNLVERAILLHEIPYHETVRKGLRRMPGFTTVLKPEAETDLLAWLRSRHQP